MNKNFWIALSVYLLYSSAVSAQDVDTSDELENPEDSSTAEETHDSISEIEERLNQRIEEATSAQKKEIERLEQEIENLREQNELLSEDQGMETIEPVGTVEFDETIPISIYGFFDLSFASFILEERSPFGTYLPRNTSFVMSQVNLYFLSQMTDALSTLVELRLSFLPHGMEYSRESIGKIGDTEIPGDSEYERVNTWVRDPLYSVYYNPGSITIERAHLTYEPFNWVNVIAGRFLTPYGIWNVDHGSPVIIPARMPYLQIAEMVPNAQTGVQIYGRFFPRYDLFFDYAFTVSNGRGPIEELIDLDDNKGLGLRLKMSYEGETFNIAGGAYGYFGKYTDIKKSSTMELNPDMTINRDAEHPLTTDTIITESYDEYSISVDLLIEFFGVGIQGEYVQRYVDVNVHGRRTVEHNAFSGASALEELYGPTNWGNGYYGLLSWELPLSKWISPVRITPYFFLERYLHDDTIPAIEYKIISGGVNVKPSPFVTLKGEFATVILGDEVLLGDPLKIINFQMAVSF